MSVSPPEARSATDWAATTQATPAAAAPETAVAVVIFGATGDLARRKLFPALYRLDAGGLLPAHLEIIGVGRRPWDDDHFGVTVAEALTEFADGFGQPAWDRFRRRLHFVSGGVDAGVVRELAQRITGSAIFYLALPPGLFADAARLLAEAGLHRQGAGFRRLVVEKPFGTDLQSARELDAAVRRDWDESQLYRIDHFLGKETVQNLLVFRFANTFLEPIWDRHHIDHVQITVAESGGLEGRGGYYDESGALRDIVQNHLMQLFTLTAMEAPALLESDELHDEKVKVLKSVRAMAPSDVPTLAVRGQYGRGVVGGRAVPGYLEEPGVRHGSTTETYVALRLYVDNWRWHRVPFYLRTGKRLAADRSEVAIRFRVPPQKFFGPATLSRIEPNWLVLSMKPDESLSLVVQAKQVGVKLTPRTVVLQAPYRGAGDTAMDAYESLLLDVLDGQRAYFLRYDEVDWAWRILQPVLDRWQAEPGPLPTYPAGAEGPSEADGILADPAHRWRSLISRS